MNKEQIAQLRETLKRIETLEHYLKNLYYISQTEEHTSRSHTSLSVGVGSVHVEARPKSPLYEGVMECVKQEASRIEDELKIL